MLVLLLLLSEGQHEHTIYDMKDLTPLVQKRIPLYKWMVELNFAIFIIKESRTAALHYSDRVIYYIKFDNCHGYLMTGVCQEFCIQRIQTARWRDIADAQSFLVMQLRRETGIWG